MPDYCVLQKNREIRTVNLTRGDKREKLTAEGYRVVWEVIFADNADAALLRYEHLRREEERAPQNFATDSVISSLFHLISH
ncbi:hypothetical protein [Pantoea anthophila]|uniref:hypothetical protein n=1 Tax=Pantoea anthophila TaxID=470931 RepID=UPI00278B421E|nr:hypothetical protein [Pantoea anthophila]MDQ1210848.1 hypothetical protein [Pantoea anthophila]